jgi:hypothetical protein
MDYISQIETVYTGGGCTIDFVHLKDGRILGINDEAVGLYDSMDAYAAGETLEFMWIPRKKTVSYDFKDGQLVELCEGVLLKSWSIYSVPDDVLRAAVAWNDKDGDFADTPRVHLLEIFLADFIQSTKG